MSVLENMKEVAELVKKLGDIDLNRKIVNLEGEVLDLTRDKRRAEAKIEELEELLKTKQALKFKAPFFWSEGDNTPFCPSCWEGRITAVHLFLNSDNSERTVWDCPNCKHRYIVEKSPGRQRLQHSLEGGSNSWMR
jgi:hypothetical protein